MRRRGEFEFTWDGRAPVVACYASSFIKRETFGGCQHRRSSSCLISAGSPIATTGEGCRTLTCPHAPVLVSSDENAATGHAVAAGASPQGLSPQRVTQGPEAGHSLGRTLNFAHGR